MVELEEPYEPRPIHHLERWEEEGWRLKVYGIAYRADRPASPLIQAAKELARKALPQPAVTGTRYGVGFLGIHQGRGANAVFLDWWADENELHHRIWTSPKGRLQHLDPVGPDGLTACIWDMAVICHEREAWVQTVLNNPEGPDLEAYLDRRFQARV